MKKLVYTLILILIVQNISAQKFVYDVDFLSYFDNRESKIPLYQSQTLFGLRLSPEVGVDFKDNTGGLHRLMAGVSYTQPFGATWKSAQAETTAYYRYNYKGFRASMGAIPYRKLIVSMPSLLMSDSLKFKAPNILGALFSYQSKHGYAEFFCDWRGMQSKTVREAFKLVINGRYNHKAFFTGAYVQLNHLAGKDASQPYEGVCDDFVFNPFVGCDVSNLTPLDSLSIKVSYITGLQRHRMAGIEEIPHGGSIELYLKWKWIGAANLFYFGNNQMPLYSDFGPLLNQGEALYANSIYNKTSFFLSIVTKSFVNLTFYYNLRYAKGYELSHQQQLVVNFNLEALMSKKKADMSNFLML